MAIWRYLLAKIGAVGIVASTAGAVTGYDSFGQIGSGNTTYLRVQMR